MEKIIDGVDVSSCKYLKQTKIPYCQIEEQIQDIITEAIGE